MSEKLYIHVKGNLHTPEEYFIDVETGDGDSVKADFVMGENGDRFIGPFYRTLSEQETVNIVTPLRAQYARECALAMVGQSKNITIGETDLPLPGQVWRHHNGNEYVIRLVANISSERPEYPITVSYQHGQRGAIYAKVLGNFLRKMERVK